MAPIAPSLARSESKAKFLRRIGLDEHNRIHRHLYSKMKAEAVEGWVRMTNNRDALLPSLRDDASVEPPYTYGQISEQAMRSEVVRIHEQACLETKIMYNLAHDDDAAPDENWIIRWLLWHVFRYRDDRNGVTGRNRIFHSVDLDHNVEASETPPSYVAVCSPPSAPLPNASGTIHHAAQIAVSRGKYWDPVRNKFV